MRSPAVILALLGAKGVTAASNSQFPSSCSETCQQLAEAGIAYETAAHADPSRSFYTVPSNFSPSLPPGSLLRLEATTNLHNYSIPSGLSMSRILYTTTDLNGTVLPTSAYILWPFLPHPLPPTNPKSQKPTSGGHPLVAFAHGTSGNFGPCAPSNYRALQYHFMAPFLLALQGLVVVAPDYAGLGVSQTPSGQTIPHPWLTGPAQANDLANAILAARKAFPSQLPAAGPFVTMGHSQGGSAAWAFAERQVERPVAGYKGSVALAPVPRALDQYVAAVGNHSVPWAGINLGLAPKLAAAVTAVFPGYAMQGLSEVAREKWEGVLGKVGGCFPTDTLVFGEFVGGREGELSKEGWWRDREVQAWKGLVDLGRKEFRGPLLVLAGDGDQIASWEGTREAVGEVCGRMGGNLKGKRKGKREELEMVTYRGVNHFPLIQASQGRWLEWVKDKLFDGEDGRVKKRGGPAKAECSIDGVVEGFRQEFTFGPTPLPNFLETWVDPDLTKEGWKYLL